MVSEDSIEVICPDTKSWQTSCCKPHVPKKVLDKLKGSRVNMRWKTSKHVKLSHGLDPCPAIP